jgi:predicted alpha/beta-hydrolase family hydrolase
MRAWTARLATLGPVTPLDYPYMLAGRKAPDRQPVLEQAHLSALRDAQALTDAQALPGEPPLPWFLAGKSMGGRIGCHVAVAAPDLVRGVICFGYPLVAGGTGKVRDEVLLALRVPALFLQGTRDPLCPIEALRAVSARMTAPHHIVEIPGGNHSLELGRSAAKAAAQTASDENLLAEIRAFIERCLQHRPGVT